MDREDRALLKETTFRIKDVRERPDSAKALLGQIWGTGTNASQQRVSESLDYEPVQVNGGEVACLAGGCVCGGALWHVSMWQTLHARPKAEARIAIPY